MPDVFKSKRSTPRPSDRTPDIVDSEEEFSEITKDYDGRVKKPDRSIPKPKIVEMPCNVEKLDGKL